MKGCRSREAQRVAARHLCELRAAAVMQRSDKRGVVSQRNLLCEGGEGQAGMAAKLAENAAK